MSKPSTSYRLSGDALKTINELAGVFKCNKTNVIERLLQEARVMYLFPFTPETPDKIRRFFNNLESAIQDFQGDDKSEKGRKENA